MRKLYLYFILIFHLVFSFSANAQIIWQEKVSNVGTFSSPRVTDLNQDGIGDIILGAGREEFIACDTAVFALDGKTGKMLWHVQARDQIFGSATLKDITGDGVDDVFIGGRSAELLAINGASGDLIWRFSKESKREALRKANFFNFYNPQFIPDQDGDGEEDLLVSNGGDVLAEPYDPRRPPGSLFVISSKSGKLIAKATMPDEKEIYMSVTVLPKPDSKDVEILFGTGGETLGGNLYVGRLSDVMAGDLSKSKRLDTSKNRGYIGPGAGVDITGDEVLDIIVNTVDGRLLAFDGKNLESIWETKMEGTETYSSVAIGHFNEDKTPDFFVSYAAGTWPKLEWSRQFMVNGKTGGIEFTDSLGFYQNTTPVVADWNNDGIDEAIMSINFVEYGELFQKYFYNMLVVIDFKNHQILQIGDKFEGQNLSSTPWIGDMDQDGLLDIIYCHGTNLRHTYTFDGISVLNMATGIPISKEITWGAYQGSQYNGIYVKPGKN